MSAAVSTPSAAGRKVLAELADLKPQIDAAQEELEKLYAKQKRLYLRGERAGLSGNDMARAEGRSVTSGGEQIRAFLRKARSKAS